MNWIALFFALELGIAPNIGVLQYEPPAAAVSEWEIGYTQLEAEVLLFDLLFAGGGVRTYITPGSSGRTFAPNTTIYDFCAGMRRGPVEVGYRHRCFHPTLPYLPLRDQHITGLEGSYDELYLRFETSIRPDCRTMK